MSERRLIFFALGFAALAAPLQAQDLARLRQHEAELTSRLAHLRAEAAKQDSVRFDTQPRRVVTFGPLHLAVPTWTTDESMEGLDQIVAERRERYGASFDSLLTDTLFIWADERLGEGDGNSAPFEWRLGELSGVGTVALHGSFSVGWVRWLASNALDKWSQSLLDPEFISWLGPTNASISLADLRDGSVRDLILSPSARGRRCVDGAIDECRWLLELGGGEEPVLDAYDPADLAPIVERLWTDRQRSGRNLCVVRHDPAACRAYIIRNGIHPSRPATGRVRQSLFMYALAAGGDAAWLRLRRAAGRPVPEQLSAAAQRPVDELLTSWQADLRAQRRTTNAGLGPNLLLALVWSIVGTLFFAWRYRWRRV